MGASWKIPMKDVTGASRMLMLFRLEGRRYALPLDAVDRVIRALAVTSVPETPRFVLGLVNLAGRLLPVISLRACLRMPDRPVRPEDQFLIARTSRLTLAVVVDEVEGLIAIDDSETVAVQDALPMEKSHLNRLGRIGGDIVLICELEELLSSEDQERILQVEAAAGV